MRNLFAVEFLFVMLVLYVGKGHSFKCYECRSDTVDGCSSVVNETLSKECPPKSGKSAAYCRKIKQQLKFKNEKGWTSIRECAYEKQGSSCYRFKWVNLGYQEICECDQENCNRGRVHIPAFLTVAIVFSLTWIFNFLKTNNT